MLAAAVVKKTGQPSDPEITPGVKMADLMKDLDMFMGEKKNEVAEAAKTPLASGAEKTVTAGNREFASSKIEQGGVLQKNLAADENAFLSLAPLKFSLDQAEEKTIFQMVRGQYLKRQNTY